MSRPRNARLSELIRRPGLPLLLPGAPNALTARVLERTGFEAVYVSGAGVSNSFLGAPDIGLLSMPEMVGHVAAIRDAVDIPLVVDADTGYGNALNVQRAIRMLERAGASAVQLEDQVTPKRCGHFEGKDVIETEEMIGKIKAAVDARLDDGLPRLVPAPHVANMVEGGHTPIVPLRDLGELGFAVVLYANTAMRAAITSMEHVAEELLRHGDSSSFTQQIATWEQRQNLVRKGDFDKLDLHYGSMT